MLRSGLRRSFPSFGALNPEASLVSAESSQSSFWGLVEEEHVSTTLIEIAPPSSYCFVCLSDFHLGVGQNLNEDPHPIQKQAVYPIVPRPLSSLGFRLLRGRALRIRRVYLLLSQALLV